MLKMVPETPLKFGVAERLSRTFRVESTGLRAEAPKMLWAVSTAYLIYRIPYVLIGLRIPEEELRGKDTSLAHLKVFGFDSFVKVKDVCGESMKSTFIGSTQMKCGTAFTIRRVTTLSEAEILHLWTRFMEPEYDSIVTEHGLSSKITQSPGGSSDTSEGSKNSRSFKDSERSDEEYSKNTLKTEHPPMRKAPILHRYEDSPESPGLRKEFVQWKKTINEEMVSLEKNQTCFLVRLPAGKKALQRLWMFKVKKEQNSSEKDRVRVMCHEPMLLLQEDGSSCIRQLLKVDDMLIVGSDMAEFNKPKCWPKLVRVLISEGSLSLLKILGTKSLAEMFTRLVMKEKSKLSAASTGLRDN
ncbi:hypothetical protein Tco_0627761 [Tanacetum coccineum]|uniref:Retrovirus-related Pol polyprotein from transposon TNT 1-94 n=1 Tax=Tanacetum coccineum TaxID=301880 RepID=A0ABQ4WND2_9ASTR